jgi:hypothetical protein
MQKRSTLFTFCLCTSLTLHVLGLSALAWWYVAYTPPPKWAAIDREKLMIQAMSQPKTNRPPPPPEQKKRKRPPLPKFEESTPQQAPKDDSGETNGKGTANRSTPGDRPMKANNGYEQADLMRDNPDPLQLDPNSLLPAAAGAQVGSNANRQSTASKGQYTPDFVAESKALTDPQSDPTKPITTHEGIGPLPVTPAEKDNAPAPSGTPTPVVATANGRQNEVPQAIKGHRAVSGDTESVAFAKANSLVIHDGKVEGRQGLKVSTKIPIFGDASRHDAEIMENFHLVLGAQVDADGNVSDVIILHSSGSPNIDLDYQNCIFNWTFEPPKDKAGHPMAAQWAITCE